MCFNSIVLRIQFRVLKPKLVKKNVAMNLVFFFGGEVVVVLRFWVSLNTWGFELDCPRHTNPDILQHVSSLENLQIDSDICKTTLPTCAHLTVLE